MPEHLKHLFDRALDDEPAFLDGEVARQVMAQGRGIRRRRQLLVGGSAAAVVAVLAALNFVSLPADAPPPEWAGQPTQVPAALAMIAKAEPQCTWPAPDAATDVFISVRHEATEQQRDALQEALGADPAVRGLIHETREEAYERFKVLWRDSPDFLQSVDVASMPESFRLKLIRSSQYAEFAATYAGRPGVEEIFGGDCP
ncbi:permease-like cell division protein FtsX [Actinoplanes sp. NPDC051861]|uniref:permease-like cell division protein FtsX n=1 Tax=Actinoplanes sp. NPDC051861 TaxID=3155170 RepID=UPI00342280D7